MRKINKTYLAIVFGLFVALIALQHFSKKPINWEIDLTKSSKSPYGCFIAHKMLYELFPKEEILENNSGFFSAGIEGKNDIIIITQDFSPDKYDLEAMLNQVSNGSIILLSSIDFSENLADTLHFETNRLLLFDTALFKPADFRLFLTDTVIRKDEGYLFKRRLPNPYFTSIDTINTRILGTNKEGEPNFLSITFGEGKILLHLQPMVFTNYHLLNSNYEYANAVLSYLPDQSLIWDNYYKPGRIINNSPVRYILSQPALRIAYQLALILLLLHFFFEGKRRQRVIPLIQPLQNTSLQFIQTVGRLYLKSGNHLDLLKKKMTYFKEFVREHYFLNLNNYSDNTIKVLAYKSGIDEEEIKKILRQADHFNAKTSVTKQDLIEFNSEIESFYKNCN